MTLSAHSATHCNDQGMLPKYEKTMVEQNLWLESIRDNLLKQMIPFLRL